MGGRGGGGAVVSFECLNCPPACPPRKAVKRLQKSHRKKRWKFETTITTDVQADRTKNTCRMESSRRGFPAQSINQSISQSSLLSYVAKNIYKKYKIAAKECMCLPVIHVVHTCVDNTCTATCRSTGKMIINGSRSTVHVLDFNIDLHLLANTHMQRALPTASSSSSLS